MLQTLPKRFIWGPADEEVSTGFHLSGPSKPVGNLGLVLRKEVKVINAQEYEWDLLLSWRGGWLDVQREREAKREG